MKTITREKMNVLAGGGLTDEQMNNIAAYFGIIIITDPDPPEAMVKLAHDAGRAALADIPDSPVAAWKAGYLAALQFADKVVREQIDIAGYSSDFTAIRRKLGAIA